MSTKQTQEDRDVAHVEDTTDMLLEILESNKIPDDIALTALCKTLVVSLVKNSKTSTEFVINSKEFFYNILPKMAIGIIAFYIEFKAKSQKQ